MSAPIIIFVAAVFATMLLHTAWQGVVFVLTSPKTVAVAAGVFTVGALIGCAMFGGGVMTLDDARLIVGAAWLALGACPVAVLLIVVWSACAVSGRWSRWEEARGE